ncbi:type III-B CRISPR-associated protein Cas10/Cmr2 [Pasteurella skyensis]|uniref:Type III-B CRISPR-associated protein Cas10/Cmr2 n=1 Tax=Phocoenobacter skyensis TaxID=97481 RepID=A0AAJ6P277_9PAST|nr:type III-B CRISPR-associated protein Cas10/Cmr2 [Pasteurella skyensis]MDP8170526.1 type III-B CRISPR-associated protein Cas10/Cmr2 [Pasteurella skyensis]MDP8174512.1 type III-B CRISPR-associated protein Cas10/Cmr2 [Pasteurella skyensis]
MNKTNKQYFHFTLGPVQSFVGQARRTRDFWAGSFLLSWLSGVAMLSVIKQQRDLVNEELDIDEIILFPKADKQFLTAIEKGCQDDNFAPKQGGIPNRFKAEVHQNFDGSKVVSDVQDAWKALANTIYQYDIEKYKNQLSLERTREIWQEQVENFWEMTWVIVDTIENSSALDRRKNWRIHYLPDQRGIKCSLMGDWQELSGIEGVSKNDNEARKLFWTTVLNSKDKTIADYGENEFLCAMAFIKRRFIRYFDKGFSLTNSETNIPKEKGTLEAIYGWELKNDVPSVNYIAAANWWANILRKCNQDNQQHLIDFFDAFKFNDGNGKLCELNEYNSSVKSIEETIKNNSHIQHLEIKNELSSIDGVLFYKSALENPHNFPKQEGKPNNTEHPELNPQVQKVATALGELIKNFAIGDPSPFYAILIMDGDSLGKQMSDRKKQKYITHALDTFTRKVGKIVSDNNGFLIYAGGDDVLALLPIEDALNCAKEIRNEYENCFKNKNIEANKKNVNIDYSISAAIVYSHINNPLSNALHDIHSLLDDVAKEKTGRNALAVQVCKQSGTVLTWTKPWDTKRLGEEDKETYQRGDTVLDEQNSENRTCVLSSSLENFQKAEKDNPQFSNRFFYKIRENFALFNSKEDGQESSDKETVLLDINHAIKIMAAEFCRSRGVNKEVSLRDAENFVQPLMRLCRDSQGNIKADAALLIKFLANYSQ